MWLLLAACSSSPPEPTAKDRLGWLVGGWRDVEGEATTMETWVAQSDGDLLGSGRVMIGQVIGFAETLAIASRDGKLEYTAWPAGQEPVRFLEKESGEYTVVFANPNHDFPREITYRRTDATHLEVSAVGVSEGEPREESWSLERLP
jgi:hypothetical protein